MPKSITDMKEPVTPVVSVTEPQPQVDIQKLMEKVRKEEKDKLYPQLEHSKQMQGQLQKQIETLENQMELVKTDDNKKVEKKSEEFNTLQSSLDDMKKDNVILRQQQEALVTESQNQILAMRLDTYRANAIAKAGPRLIPELVLGRTEAEIDAAIMESKKRFNDIETSVKNVLTNNKANAPIPSIGGQPPQPLGNPQSAQELTADAINHMSAEEWAKKRMEIRKDVDNTMKGFFQGK